MTTVLCCEPHTHPSSEGHSKLAAKSLVPLLSPIALRPIIIYYAAMPLRKGLGIYATGPAWGACRETEGSSEGEVRVPNLTRGIILVESECPLSAPCPSGFRFFARLFVQRRYALSPEWLALRESVLRV